MFHSTIRQIVNEAYKKRNICSLNDLSLETLSRRFMIDLDYSYSQTSSLQVGHYKLISLDKRIPSHYQRWDFFHELGHILLHNIDQKKALKGVSFFMELQAYRFALHASMPYFLIKKFCEVTPYTLSYVFNIPIFFAERRMEQIKTHITIKGGKII
ncbi:ImmA/IrrE family metallo-endopeptidase [Salicibibacter kimchii]|uniref:ImmA/IrrE family metallo-endopeptidase n=1 Tax=Salicibibacter kimchii TaxID=2099786 RepID=A0A345C0U6_9BACI|nr:ImmA/IrrE family metallo-endopeptidase [Salicibibacter kimchii]AXF56827.1 ImmA/IrrE family metallo-endopeptidase [Salicibibacter kimchii]